MTYPGNGIEAPQMAPRINRNQILDHNTLSGNEILQNEIKQMQAYNLKSQRDKMQAERLQKFQHDNDDTISALTDDFYGSIASGNTANSNHDQVHPQHDSYSFASNLTGNFYNSIASGNTAYATYDQSQAGDSTLNGSLYGSCVAPMNYYNIDDDCDIRYGNSSRYNKLLINTTQFTTPKLPSDIESFEEEGVLNGDNRSTTENITDHSAHHRDTPNGGYDALPNEKYDGEEKTKNI